MKQLETPRLQIVWEETKEEFIATYEMVLYEGEEALLDVRANNDEGRPTAGQVKVKMGQTKCSGARVPFNYDDSLSTPFRDGVHIMRDSIKLGNLPMYVIYGDKVEKLEQILVEKEGQLIHRDLVGTI